MYKRIHINGLKALGLFLVKRIVKVVVHWYSKNTSHHRKCSLRTHTRAFASSGLHLLWQLRAKEHSRAAAVAVPVHRADVHVLPPTIRAVCHKNTSEIMQVFTGN